MFCLAGETAENTPVLYGPLITEDIYNGECFKSDEKRSFKMETLEPWLAFTLKIPLVSQDGNVKGLSISTDLLCTSMDNLHNRLTSDLGKKNEIFCCS